MENERRNMAAKRVQERDFLKRMMAENEANKLAQQQKLNAEKESDIKALVEYGNMLDKQEADR